MSAPTANPQATGPSPAVARGTSRGSRGSPLLAVRESLPEPVLRAGRRTVGLYGSATARWRTTADFLVIGCKRGGTTSMYHHLLQHPSVMELFPTSRLVPKRSPTKGLHFFDADTPAGELAYRAHFPTHRARVRAEETTSGPVVVGEASPYYLFHPTAASRAAEAVPGAKLIAILRDPIERTFSHYREQVRNGAEALTFEQALDAEPERLATTDPAQLRFAHENQSYAAQSEYGLALQRWLEVYPREQLLVVSSEAYFARPGEVLDQIVTFLGLPLIPVPAPPPLNAAPKSPMAPETRERLALRFAGANELLFELVGQSFPWQRPAA